MRHPLLAAVGAAVATVFLSAASAQAPATMLTGLVSSPEEAAMEGVLVSATKAGSNITVTVVTGTDGRYSFPANRLGPGRYTLGVRAVGYELDQPEGIEIGATGARDQREDQKEDQHATTKDLRLGKTKDLAALTQVSGIGKKGAERMVLELRDKIGAIETDMFEGKLDCVRQCIDGLAGRGIML